MKKYKNIEIRLFFVGICLLFAVFLVIPAGMILVQSFAGQEGFTLKFYANIMQKRTIGRAFANSMGISLLSALLTTAMAFILAYTIHYTNVSKRIKKGIQALAVLPMLLPTITYGFALIYSFGRQGLLTRIFGRQLCDIYGINGLLMGYIIYTLPVAFMLIHNTMGYIDKRFDIVSRLMGDMPVRRFYQTVFRPLLGTLGASVIQCFFLSFTDFGIPASVGGQVEVIGGVLYNEMLGSVPNFNQGAVVALIMLLPSALSIGILTWLERYNIRYHKVSQIERKNNLLRDWGMGTISAFILLAVLAVFAVILVIPFVEEWPYKIQFTTKNIRDVFADASLIHVLGNSLKASILTAAAGSLVAYGAALVTVRSTIHWRAKKIVEGIALITNTIPGMVLGIAFMLTFSGTSLQNTMALIIFCNIIHFFSTPYLMLKSSLEKMNASWEATARLMGDSWTKTILRIVTPNMLSTLLEVFSYYFINSMVTVSAVVFLTGARTMVITTKIKELQHYAKFNEIFVLSLVILFVNLAARALFRWVAERKEKKKRGNLNMKKNWKKGIAAIVLTVITGTGLLTGCGKAEEQVIIYSNADDEAVVAMKETLDENGYEGKYIFQSFGTSELGGKLLAEGKDIEADLVTMSSFYLDSAQEQKELFRDLTFETNALTEFPSFYTPITSQEGAIIVNTQMMEDENLPMPVSLKDLAKPEYQGFLSVTDITGSSTAWLMIQALVSEYGEEEAQIR